MAGNNLSQTLAIIRAGRYQPKRSTSQLEPLMLYCSRRQFGAVGGEWTVCFHKRPAGGGCYFFVLEQTVVFVCPWEK